MRPGPNRGKRRVRPRAAPLAELVDRYIDSLRTGMSKRGRPYSPHTVEGWRTHLRIFVQWAGAVPVEDITAEMVGRYLREQFAEGKTANTVYSRERPIRGFLTWCAARGILARDPLARLPRTRPEDSHVETLSDQDVYRLIAACDRETWGGLRDATIIWVLWRTGLRRAELCALDLADYDQREGTLAVRHGKGDKRRVVGVSEDLAAALREWLADARGPEPGPLFPSERGGRFSENGLAQMMGRLEQRSGIHDIHAHRFRHTFAVAALRNGMDIYTLSRLLGHSSITMSSKYLRALQQEQAVELHRRTFRRVK